MFRQVFTLQHCSGKLFTVVVRTDNSTIGGDQSESYAHRVLNSCLRQTDPIFAVGGQPRVYWSDWKDQHRWNRDCRRYLRGMIRTSTFRICVAVMQLQNNFTFQTIVCPEFPRQWPSASARCVTHREFQMPRFIRQEMHSSRPRLQRVANATSDTPAESASSAA